MTKPLALPSAEAISRIRAMAETQLDPAEVEARLAIPIRPEEREEIQSLIYWFCRRYPTPGERLAYARRASKRWVAAMPAGAHFSA